MLVRFVAGSKYGRRKRERRQATYREGLPGNTINNYCDMINGNFMCIVLFHWTSYIKQVYNGF